MLMMAIPSDVEISVVLSFTVWFQCICQLAQTSSHRQHDNVEQSHSTPRQ